MVHDYAELKRRINADVPDDLLHLAMTHRSYAYENGGLPTNERLEFLGDAVLGLVVTVSLYTLHPNDSEGQLAKLRSGVVNARALATIARGIGLGEFILLGRGEEATGGRDKASILADTMEAVIGATYLGAGLEAATRLVHELVDPLIEQAATLGAGLDWKTSLQELASARSVGLPEYVVTDTGPDHAKVFTATVHFLGRVLGTGEGKSKKEAEQNAAAAAFAELGIASVHDD